MSKLRYTILGFTFFGILLASYLFYSYVIQPQIRPCTINAKINCDAVINGEVSKTFGIPTSLYGLIGYLIILAGVLTNRSKLVLGMAIFGTLFCLRITIIELTQLHVYCPVCLLCQFTMIIILILAAIQQAKLSKLS